MQIRTIALAVFVAFALPACMANMRANEAALPGNGETAEDRIEAVLMAQQTAWNAGDIDGFMASYWQSPDLRFASGGSVTRGWQNTRDRYHRNYANRALMGTLTFSDLEVQTVNDDAAIVHGGWALQRAKDAPSGLFTLIFRKIDGEWKIVSDTTTSAN